VLKKILKEVELITGKQKAANRMEWRSIVGAVRAGTRLQHQYGDQLYQTVTIKLLYMYHLPMMRICYNTYISFVKCTP
jgi:hypothetical protein